MGELLERRTSRRGALSRAAVAGAAFAVAPVRYLVRPGTAWAVLAPRTARTGSRCTDGYTAFCCEIEQGNNACPPDTYIAGLVEVHELQGQRAVRGTGRALLHRLQPDPGHRIPGRVPVRAGRLRPPGGRLQPLPLRAVQHPDRRHHRGRLPARALPEPRHRARDELQRDRDGRQPHLHARSRLPPGPGQAAARRRGRLDRGRARVGRDRPARAAGRARRRAPAQPRRDPPPARPRGAGAPRLPAPPAGCARATEAPELAGVTPTGDAIKLALDGTPTLLAFLSSGCTSCAGLLGDARRARVAAGCRR